MTRRRAPRVLLGALCVLLSWPALAGAQSDTESARDDVRDRRAAVEEEIDVLRASDAEIDAALDELDAAIEDQLAAVDEARAEARAAAAEERAAIAARRAAERRVERLRVAIREMAVASFVHPPSSDLVTSLQASTLSEALIQQQYLDARASRDLSLLDQLESARAAAADAALAAERAASAAELALSRADAELGVLEARRADQVAFAGQLQARIDRNLGEAAALADLDQELSEQIAAEQAELIARLPPPPPTTTTTTRPRPTTDEGRNDDDADPSGGDAGEDGSGDDDPDTDGDAGDGSADDSDHSDRYTEPPPLVTVQGITVHEELGPDVDALLDAAAEDGVDLSGSGYRSTERQVELRRQNCGPTEYDIWDRPASECSPPTARPGTSMHEQGRAIDFTYEGRLITSDDNEGYRWLRANAATFGFLNLPEEPWHWSTNGN